MRDTKCGMENCDKNPDLSSNVVRTYSRINVSNVNVHSVPNYVSNVFLVHIVIAIFTFLLANILPVGHNVGWGNMAFKIRNHQETHKMLSC